MKESGLIVFLKQHILAQEETIGVLTGTVDRLTAAIDSLTQEVSDLKVLLLEKDKATQKIIAQMNGLAKIALPKKTEKTKIDRVADAEKTPALTPKQRGNNGAKRKDYCLKEDVKEVFPDGISEGDKTAVFLFSRDVIRYEYMPPRLIKYIYRCMTYRRGDEVLSGVAPKAPFLNSNFDSSFLAFLIQQRYVYGMPVERILKYLNEMGIHIPKATIHGLVEKAAGVLDRLIPVLKDAVLSDPYIHFDETYHTILGGEKKTRKGYFWSALSHKNNLIHFFYDKGSRAKKVFTDYLPKNYCGAIQTDGYSPYKVVEGWDYLRTTRLGCMQHCKRKFLEIEEQEEAQRIIGLYNKFYRIRKDEPEQNWIKKSEVVYKELESELRAIERDDKTIPNSILRSAVAYCLNELESIYNIICSTQYDLDNNQIERPMRYISISRRNSMFCGSDAGAARTAVIYSLAISCRLNEINTFEYFKDIIMRLANTSPTESKERLRNILPDRWADQ